MKSPVQDLWYTYPGHWCDFFCAVSALVLISWLACNCVSGVAVPGSTANSMALQCKCHFSGKFLKNIRVCEPSLTCWSASHPSFLHKWWILGNSGSLRQQLTLDFPNEFLHLAFVSQLLEFVDEIKCILGERKNQLPEFPLRKIMKTQLCAGGIYLSHV